MQTVKLSDADLVSAAGLVRQSMLKAAPSPAECERSFSEGFIKKMQQLISRENRKTNLRKAGRSVAAAILLIAFCASVWLATDSAARAAFASWVRRNVAAGVEYRFKVDVPGVIPQFKLAWIPEGMEMTDLYEDESDYIAVYSNAAGEAGFVFHCFLMNTGTLMQVHHLNPDKPRETVMINGVAADFYPGRDKYDSNNLIIMNEQAGVVISFNSLLEKDVIMHIAEGVVLVDQTK